MAKRKKVVLPRLTLLAYSRRDLVAFTSAVEALRCITTDLRQLVEDLGRKTRKPKRPPTPAEATAELDRQLAAVDLVGKAVERLNRPEGETDGA